jgi:hypothetical protein
MREAAFAAVPEATCHRLVSWPRGRDWCVKIRLMVVFGRMPFSSVSDECADERAAGALWPGKATAPAPSAGCASRVLY